MSNEPIHIPPEWKQAAEEILGQGGPVIIIGAPGAGKTTFALFLTGCLCGHRGRVTWIDGDPGQPFFGPPATVSLTLHTEPVDVSKQKTPLSMGFIGDTSPVGHLLDVLSGLQMLSVHAQGLEPDLVLVNTCGLIAGSAGRELMFHQIDLLQPRYVVALQRTNEVEHLLSPHAHRGGLLLTRLPVWPGASSPSRESRKAFREQRFKEYFRGADFQDIALTDVGIHGPGLGTGERLGFRDINRLSNLVQGIVVHAEQASDKLFLVTDGDYGEEGLYAAKEQYGVREVSVFKRSDFDHLLLGLNDDQNICLGLGILREIDFKEQTVRLITPVKDCSAIRHLGLGTLRVSPAGAELGRW